MAGHSAWKNIKHRKAAVDAKRGKIWSKLSRAIIVAAKQGGGDQRFNATLRLAVDEAKAANMPRDTIEKAIKKGSGELGAESFESVRYEGYAPGGVAVIAECLTSNVNRTAPEVRTAFDKHGGNLGVPGSVSFGFVQRGVVVLDGASASEERMMELALEAGAEDVALADGVWQVTCEPSALAAVRDAFVAAGLQPMESQIMWLPLTTVSVSADDAQKVSRLVETLEEHDDVQKVYTNAELPE